MSGFPSAIGQSFEQARQGDINILVLLGIGALAISVIAGVVYVERGQRRITINYARRQQGRQMYAAQTSHLPLNTANSKDCSGGSGGVFGYSFCFNVKVNGIASLTSCGSSRSAG